MALKRSKTRTTRTAGRSVTTATTYDGYKKRTVTRTTTPRGTVTEVHTSYVSSGKTPNSKI